MQIIYRLYGAIFYRHWYRLYVKLSWYNWFNDLIWGIVDLGPKSWLRKLVWWFVYPAWVGENCPNCGHDFEKFQEPYFESTNWGCGDNDLGTCYWWYGVQTCPRCGYKWRTGD